MNHLTRPYTSSKYFWNYAIAFFYSSDTTPLHTHNTMQIVFDIQHEFRFRIQNENWISCKGLILKENVAHQLSTNNSVQMIIYLDPNSPIARLIKNKFLSGTEMYPLDANIFNIFNPGDLQDAIIKRQPILLEKVIRKLLNSLVGKYTINETDKRIFLIKQIIATTHPEKMQVEYLAKKIFLSKSRLRSLFKEITGMPIYQYFLSNKTMFATNLILAGATLKDAAFEAGFTDISHFHKAMVKFHNISPSNFIKQQLLNTKIICNSKPLNLETTTYA